MPSVQRDTVVMTNKEAAVMDGVIGRRVLRCSDGHLFNSSEGGRLFTSIHFGPKRLMRCPVDHKWRIMSNVDRRDLPPEQIAQLDTDGGKLPER